MYKVIPDHDLVLKTYWCTSLDLAAQVAEDLERRFRCSCRIEDVPEKKQWQSCSEAPKRFTLSDGVELRCTTNEFSDATAHVRDNVLKIHADEIFCFPAEDVVWQQR